MPINCTMLTHNIPLRQKCLSYALSLYVMIYFFQKFDENAGRQWLDHFLYTDQSTTKDENCHVEKEGKVIVIFALSIKF